MILGLLAVQWVSRRTPIVTDAEWLDEAQALAWMLELRNVRFLRGGTRDDADGVGHLPAVGRDADGSGRVAGGPAPRRAAP